MYRTCRTLCTHCTRRHIVTLYTSYQHKNKYMHLKKIEIFQVCLCCQYIVFMVIPKYIVEHNVLYVCHDTNEKLDLFCEEFRSIDTLIFAKDQNSRVYSHFDQPVVLTSSIVKLILGRCFNQPIMLSRVIKVLTFGYCFNQPIVLSRALTVLTFGWCFNQPIVLTHAITTLTLGFRFNQPIILSRVLTVLALGCDFNQSIVLPKHIVQLTLGICFNRSIILTPYVKHLTLGLYFNQPIVLSPYITHLTIECNNYNVFDYLPNNIKCLTFGDYFGLSLDNISCQITKITVKNARYKYKYLIPCKLIGT